MSSIDISEWKGKKQRLQTRIVKEVEKQLDDLPTYLVMTMPQYEILKNTPEFGRREELDNFKPEDRIYHTKYNAMEIVIV